MTPKINWRPSTSELRKFGWTILIGFGIIGLIIFFKGNPQIAYRIWGGAVAICLLTLTLPSLSKPFYWIWMGIALVLGTVMSRVVLSLIFFLILTPVALFFRLVKRDELRRRRHAKEEQTHWRDLPEITDPKYYDHLF
ncbi:MAG: hypothetical protein KCHDKBKB_00321 [Elusimicrobia bacterium]|nr:hypothetical protein [Elusimicrobiota bacterium]